MTTFDSVYVCYVIYLAGHSPPSLSRSLRDALCFSSSLSFAVLASSTQTHKSCMKSTVA